ncbi:MAG: imidazole glycerol phosphate synthase subunit HisF [Synergistota bacterium]|nr:imidazole glycerol phosphate synthase subunit HisF [Synergistota bacterium]
MLTRRIVPCLDVSGGNVVKGVRFCDLKEAGSPASMARTYMEEGADELVFLDISATAERRETMETWVRETAEELFIPFTVGGGVSDVDQARRLVALGADKISLNTAAVRDPDLITGCARLLGEQAVVVAVDAKKHSRGGWNIAVQGGSILLDLDAVSWVREAVSKGCGEILLTSIDNDGVREGYDLELVEAVSEAVKVPVIASGGAGRMEHFRDAFAHGAEAALAASLFHFGELKIPNLKKWLAASGVPVRLCAGVN